MTDTTLLTDTLNRWNTQFLRLRPDLSLCGSPERCAARMAVEDQTGACLILEELAPQTVSAKQRIADSLQHLAHHGLRVVTPLPGANGRCIQQVRGRFWQLTPFVASQPLDHATYWQEAWRGQALARYLTDLRHAARNLALTTPVFDLPGYVRRIMADAAGRHPRVWQELRPVRVLLDSRLPEMHADLPVMFSHGDPHPGNMLWGRKDILTAIDWEFCGPKHALYDPALIIGCVGSEAPEALDGPFVRGFLATLRDRGQLDSRQETALPVVTLAQRTAWLAEWLRREDREMIDFEIFYMQLLADRI